MLVSVVIPAYNAESFIAATVAGVLAQTHAELELIVVDDGSADRTGEIVGQMADERVRVLRFENAGTIASRNRGLREARGEFVAFLDHDDTWFAHKLERQLDVFAREPDALAVGSLMNYISERGNALGVSGQDPRDPERQAMVRDAALMPCAMSSILWRSDAMRRAGEFDPTVWQNDEMDMLTRILPHGRMSWVPEALGEHRLHSGSITARNYSLQRMTARFLHARLAARRTGRDLEWEEFAATYRPSAWVRRNDRAAYLYRTAGMSAVERRFARAAGCGLMAFATSPGYVFPRLRRQIFSAAGRATLRAGRLRRT